MEYLINSKQIVWIITEKFCWWMHMFGFSLWNLSKSLQRISVDGVSLHKIFIYTIWDIWCFLTGDLWRINCHRLHFYSFFNILLIHNWLFQFWVSENFHWHVGRDEVVLKFAFHAWWSQYIFHLNTNSSVWDMHSRVYQIIYLFYTNSDDAIQE